MAGGIGLVVFMGLAWLVSSHRTRVPWRVVIGGLLLQFACAVVVFHTPPGEWLRLGIDAFFAQLSEAVSAGSGFVFNERNEDGSANASLLTSFAFGVLPTVIVFASVMSVLYHIRVMDWVVSGIAWVMRFTLGTSGAESLAAAANVFIGHTEAPLVVRPFIKGMTRSELNAMMVGGFATITGSLIPAFGSMGISPSHLVTASVISAPAALLIAKLMQPETETPETTGNSKAHHEEKHTNVLEAAAVGASDGLKLALNIGAMLIAFLAIIALLNAMLGGLGEGIENLLHRAGSEINLQWSLEKLLGYLFWPMAWLMGIETSECMKSAELLGIKVVANEFVAFQGLSDWINQDVGAPSARTQLILTYGLAGFTNFAAIGIQIGGIGGIVPERRKDLAQLGLRAMFGGMLACSMTAAIAGLIY